MCDYRSLTSDILSDMTKADILEKVVRSHKVELSSALKKQNLIESLQREVGDERLFSDLTVEQLRTFCRNKSFAGHSAMKVKEKLQQFVRDKYTATAVTPGSSSFSTDTPIPAPKPVEDEDNDETIPDTLAPFIMLLNETLNRQKGTGIQRTKRALVLVAQLNQYILEHEFPV